MANKSNGMTVVISRDKLGEGEEALGKILIKSFIYSLTELEEGPRNVIFINSGVHLTTNGANTVDDIKSLEEAGAEILICGTCANYYGIQDNLEVGTITNMTEITKRMALAGSVVNI